MSSKLSMKCYDEDIQLEEHTLIDILNCINEDEEEDIINVYGEEVPLEKCEIDAIFGYPGDINYIPLNNIFNDEYNFSINIINDNEFNDNIPSYVYNEFLIDDFNILFLNLILLTL